MSFVDITWAMTQELPATEKMVLITLADFKNSTTGICNPGKKTIARKAGLSVRSVDDCLLRLQRRGLILGALLLDNDVYDSIADRLSPDDFHHRDHRAIFEGIQRLCTKAVSGIFRCFMTSRCPITRRRVSIVTRIAKKIDDCIFVQYAVILQNRLVNPMVR